MVILKINKGGKKSMRILNYQDELIKIIAQMRENSQIEGNIFNWKYFVQELSPLYTGYSPFQCNKLIKLARKYKQDIK